MTLRPSPDPLADPVAAFAAGLAFPLDDFQERGMRALAAGHSTLVAAPTGAGKTLVGEFAIWWALQRGGKCFYTTPIKALSNQKFHDLTRAYGAGMVGLLTGDHSIDGEAPVVVMTTEVLRNMLYERSPTLTGLHAVVLDEVHYLGDRERGAVWEEVIIQLPGGVAIACLSATVSNAEEFGEWLAEVRGAPGTCEVVISDRRPVPLEHHYAIGEDLHRMFVAGKGPRPRSEAEQAAARQGRGGIRNPEVVMLERQASQRRRVSGRGRTVQTGPRLRPPKRSQLVRELAARRWLPAICFVFSRQGCDAAVGQLVLDGVRLTSEAERAEIKRRVEERVASLEPEDLNTLGFARWASALGEGIAAHHAGMVPLFREVVEDLFARNLVKVCFATETLALGINMPARTVVIERLEKWDGTAHELLTPGQFTQLTGRAGRRGLDPVGHAVVAYQRDLDFKAVSGLVASRVEPLVSRFAPSYNMAVNLLRGHSRTEVDELLASSFAQFQADRRSGGTQEALAHRQAVLEGSTGRVASQRGDFEEYWALRAEVSRLESAGERDRKTRRAMAVEEALLALRPGDVIAIPSAGRRRRLAAVVGRTVSKAGAPLADVVTDDREMRRLGPRDLDRAPERVGRISLPAGHHRQPAYRRGVQRALEGLGPAPGRARDVPTDPEREARVAALHAAIREHPVHRDPALPELEEAARSRDRQRREVDGLERDLRHARRSLVDTLDRVVGLLSELGYLDALPSPTADGLLLAGLYGDTDLVLAEAVRDGILDDLTVAELAAAASLFTFEARGPGDAAPPRWPTRPVREVAEALAGIHARIAAHEEVLGLPPTRPLDPGFAAVTWRWASGEELDVALDGSDLAQPAPSSGWSRLPPGRSLGRPAGALTPGDFVRATKQVADVLGQLADARRGPASATARPARTAILRGVVASAGL